MRVVVLRYLRREGDAFVVVVAVHSRIIRLPNVVGDRRIPNVRLEMILLSIIEHVCRRSVSVARHGGFERRVDAIKTTDGLEGRKLNPL